MDESKSIELKNGEKVAVTRKGSSTERFLFVCHGFGGNRARQSEYLELADDELSVVTLDFRGNGESDGDFIDQDLSSRIEDLEAVVEHFDPEETFLFGTSFGGKVVLHSLKDLDVEAALLKAPVTYNSIMDRFHEAVREKGSFEFIEGKPIDERFFEDFSSHSFEEAAENIDIPVAIFHGADDSTVHIENSVDAFSEIATDVMLQKYRGEKHSFSDEAKEKLLKSMNNWIDSLN